MTIKPSLLFIVLVTAALSAQTNDQYYANEEYVEEEYFEPLNDKSSEGQMIFVEELLDLAGYIIETIEVYQTLPNSARIYRVKYNENTQGGFIFIRWDKKKKKTTLPTR